MAPPKLALQATAFQGAYNQAWAEMTYLREAVESLKKKQKEQESSPKKREKVRDEAHQSG